MDLRALDAIVDSYKGDILATMKRWIKIPSVLAEPSADNAPFGAQTRLMLDMALEDARAMGFETRDFDGYAMHAEMGEGESTLGILCHLDVVPAGDGWTRDPWGAEIDGGRVYGRGVMDNKGAAILALYAMKAVREANIPLSDAVRLILGCDEETGMTDMRYYAAHAKLPDYGFSPDAEFPVINIEKGSLGLVLGALTGGEAGADIPVYDMYAGERPNVVPGTATATLGAKDLGALEHSILENARALGFDASVESAGEDRLRLTCVGVSAHASMPEKGKNAAGMLLLLLKAIGAGGGSKRAIECLADKIGLAGDGRALGIACEDAESGALTCNLGILRYDGVNLTAQLDNRYPLCASETAICGNAVKAVSDAGMYVICVSAHPPHHVSKDHKVVKGLIAAYSEATGEEGYAFAIGGGTYSRCMPNSVAFGLNFPGDTDPIHMPDESMEIDKMMLSARILARAIVKLAGKGE